MSGEIFNRKSPVVMVDKDLYDAMVFAFNKVKDERLRNKQMAGRLEKDLEYLGHEMDAYRSKIAELIMCANNLDQDVQNIMDYSLRVKLGNKSQTLVYETMEMEDKVHKIGGYIKRVRNDIKPFKEELYKDSKSTTATPPTSSQKEDEY